MVNVSALLFVREAQRTDDGGLNLLGAVWDTINIRQGDPIDGGCYLAVLMQSDDPMESNDVSIEVKAWREDIATPTINKMTVALDPSVIGRNRTAVVIVPGAFFSEPGNYVVTAATLNVAPTAFLRVAVIAVDEVTLDEDTPAQTDEVLADEALADEPVTAEANTDETEIDGDSPAEADDDRPSKRRVFARSRA